MPGNIANYMLLNRISGEEDFLWQYDYGQKMLITGIDLPAAYEVHFANSSRGNSVPKIGDRTGVLIPDVVLTSGKPVYFWLFLHAGETDGQTVYGGIISVKPRTALPTVEPPTPEQQSILDELMAAMSNAVSHVDDVAEGIPTAIDTALEQAKQSGEFDGPAGAVFTPNVTDNGVISWSNDSGLPNPETVDLGNAFATRSDIDGKLDRSEKGVAGGVAELDGAGKVLSSQLPSFVDDVVEYPSLSAFPSTGESGKIYVSTSNNTAYRWSGTQYVPIGGSLTLGETSTTAYRGDRGSAAFSHALAKGSAYANGLYKIRTNTEGHIIEATAVTKQDIVDLGIPGSSVDPSTLIDDTTPAANKTFSSSKVDGELTQVKSDLTAKPTIKDSLKTGVDFDLSDPDGNVVARLYDGHIKTKKFDSAVIDEWYGADYVSHGDSITWQDGKAYVQGEHTGEIARGYQTVLKEMLGIDQYTNYGKSGWSMAVVNSNGVVNTIIGVSSYAGIDLCTIACGTNDFKLNVSIGSIGQIGDLTFDDTTFYGAFRKAIEYILTSNPTIRLVLMTPLQRDNSGYDVNTTNLAGHKLIDYVDAVKALGQMYGLPVCDMFANSGFTKKTLDTYTMDGLHPNDVGYQRMGDYLTHFIMNVGK